MFFSKDDFENKEETLKKFSRFGILNGWAFFVTGRFFASHPNANIYFLAAKAAPISRNVVHY